MLLALIHWLADSTSLGWLRVFNYLTLRAVLAALTAFFIALALGPAVIRELRKLKVGQAVRQYGPKSHLVKEGTPTMGGILIPSASPRFCGWISATDSFGSCFL